MLAWHPNGVLMLQFCHTVGKSLVLHCFWNMIITYFASEMHFLLLKVWADFARKTFRRIVRPIPYNLFIRLESRFEQEGVWYIYELPKWLPISFKLQWNLDDIRSVKTMAAIYFTVKGVLTHKKRLWETVDNSVTDREKINWSGQNENGF